MSDIQIDANHISLSRQGRDVLKSVSFQAKAGELVGLLGPNGAGKSTLLHILTGLVDPDRGAIRIQGKPIQDWKRRDLSRVLAYLPQGHECHWPITVERMVSLGRIPRLQPWQRIGRDDDEAIQAAIAAADIAHLAQRPVNQLSGGEQARAALARSIAVGAPILLADEPIAGLDPYHQLHVMEMLRQSARDGKAVVVVLHDLTMAARFCDRLVMLSQGSLVAEGPADKVLSADALARGFHIRAHAGARDGEPYVVPWTREVANG